VHFALKSMPSIGRAAEFLHLVRTECALVLPMKKSYKKLTNHSQLFFLHLTEID